MYFRFYGLHRFSYNRLYDSATLWQHRRRSRLWVYVLTPLLPGSAFFMSLQAVLDNLPRFHR